MRMAADRRFYKCGKSSLSLCGHNATAHLCNIREAANIFGILSWLQWSPVLAVLVMDTAIMVMVVTVVTMEMATVTPTDTSTAITPTTTTSKW